MFKYSLIIIAIVAVVSGGALATTDVLGPTNDSYIYEGQPDDNFGTHTYGYIGSDGGGELWGMFLFDLNAYSGVTVNSAFLRIYVDASYGAFPPNDPYFKIFTGSWSETGITWNNKPPGSYYFSINDPPLDDWWEIDITYYVDKWVTVWPNYGAFIDAHPTGNDNFRFRTKEFTGNTYDPHLVLTYNESPVESTSLGEIKAVFK